MSSPEFCRQDNAEYLLDQLFTRMFGEMTICEQVTFDWASQILEEYNNLPKGNSAERRKLRSFVSETSSTLSR